jgi:hypothetical protein
VGVQPNGVDDRLEPSAPSWLCAGVVLHLASRRVLLGEGSVKVL